MFPFPFTLLINIFKSWEIKSPKAFPETKEPIKENIAYLNYLDNTLKNSVKEGLDVFEILEKPIPKEFESFTMFKEEFERSVINLYPSYEKDIN